MNYQLYKILEYKKHPQPTIILGDSRANSLKEELFTNAGMNEVYNFAYGGGTLYEALDTFWLANESKVLNKVILCIPFNLYTESNNLNRMKQSMAVSQSNTAYYFSTLVTKASLFNLLARASGKVLKTEKPSMSKSEFWEHQLGPITKGYYESWAKPIFLYHRLNEVVSHCKANNIDVKILLPPTHEDLQQKVNEFGLQEEYAIYKEDLQSLCTVLDFDFRNDLTEKKKNFKDPYHFNKEIAQYIVNVIARTSGQNRFCRVLTKDSMPLGNRGVQFAK